MSQVIPTKGEKDLEWPCLGLRTRGALVPVAQVGLGE